MSARLAPPSRPWADLPPDLLNEVSCRLHDAADFIRFHAICKPWREHAAAARPSFQPWLLAPCQGLLLHSVVDYRSEAKSSPFNHVMEVPPRALSRSTRDRNKNCVSSADGTAAWLFTPRPRPRLHDLFTGAVTTLPQFPDDGRRIWKSMIEYPRCIVYGDGTVFLYTSSPRHTREGEHRPTFTAAILRPGDAAWTVKQDFQRVSLGHVAVYHDGKVIACAGRLSWCLSVEGDHKDIIILEPTWEWDANQESKRHHSYLLASHGEVMRVSVLIEHILPGGDLPPRAHAVTVHALEGAGGGGGGKMRWVERDGRSLGDRVLFLGSPASFAMDAAQLGVRGGCVYFLLFRGVYRYDLIVGETKDLQWMCSRWGGDGTCVWLRPKPAIASIEEIKERLDAYSKNTQNEY